LLLRQCDRHTVKLDEIEPENDRIASLFFPLFLAVRQSGE
jgi:hypothetical protein